MARLSRRLLPTRGEPVKLHPPLGTNRQKVAPARRPCALRLTMRDYRKLHLEWMNRSGRMGHLRPHEQRDWRTSVSRATSPGADSSKSHCPANMGPDGAVRLHRRPL